MEEVTLPESVSEADIDAIIFSKPRLRSLKVARVIIDVEKVCEGQGMSIDAYAIGARIRLLADTDRIESFGDVRKWRRSEISLKGRTSLWLQPHIPDTSLSPQ